MEISVSDAKAQLTELVRLAEAGEDIVLTRHGNAAVRLVPVRRTVDGASRRALLERVQSAAPPRTDHAVSAARSQDLLYDDTGLPE